MARSVKGALVIVVAVAVSECSWFSSHESLGLETGPGCPAGTAPANTSQLGQCLAGLTFDTVAAVGDEQRLMVRGSGTGAACRGGDTTQTCRHGPLAKIEPVVGAHQRDTTELNGGRIIARLFLRGAETESYPKLGLTAGDTVYWWVKRISPTKAISHYMKFSQDSVAATPVDTIDIEVHPPGTFKQALARFIWDDADEKTQGPCGVGCCR
jgi:hypothetical protein